MAPRLPGVEDLGRTPDVNASRAVGVADMSGIARGEAAWAQATDAFGKGLGKLGEAAGEVGELQSRFQYSQAHSTFLVEETKLRGQFANDTDYPTLEQRYRESVTKLRDKSAEIISSPNQRGRFYQNTDVSIANNAEGFAGRARKFEGDAQQAWTVTTNNSLIDNAMTEADPLKRTQYIDAAIANIDGLAAKGYISALDAVNRKQEFARLYAVTDGIVRAKTDPQGVLNELQAAPGTGVALTNRILQIEGTGKNPNSTASGDGQFIDSTWLDVLKRNRPELVQGRSDAELLALKNDKALARDMTDVYRQENVAFLKRKGIEPTAANQYLAHFLGAGGAAAMINADPNLPAKDALAAAVGEKKAQAMVDANPTILNSLAGNVRKWADGKMGGAGAVDPIYTMLPPAVRAQLASHAQAELNKQTATDNSNFKTRIEDTLAEAGRNGVAEKPVTQGEFIRALGAQKGLDAYADYQSDMKLRTDISQVSRMTPQQQSELVKSYDPMPGEEGFSDQSKRQALLQTAISRSRKERDDDPATFAISRIPVVQEAWGTLGRSISDPATPMAAKQAAARDFANKTMSEQERAGVAATDVRVLPKGYVESLKARLDNPQESGGTANVVQQLKNEAALWGDSWPKVYRQIAPEVGPLVRVIGSGVSDNAGRILAELAPQKLSDILKDQSGAKTKQVENDVLTAFTPFVKSMAGNEGSITVFNDFRVQGEKLSAYYIVQGMSSSDAAAKAFKELIGDRYEFRDSWRAPKGLTVSADDIQRGTVNAMRDLVDIGIAPPRDTIGGLSPNYLMKAKADAIRRDGKWVTAPDESGLALIYNDEAVRGTNGKPLILSWSQLGGIADRQKREEAKFWENPSAVDGGILR